jgi:hypothetical protein
MGTGAGIEGLALGGQDQAARGPLQKPCAEAVFEPGHQLGQGGGGQPHIPRRSRKSACFHGANKSSHLGSTIHEVIMD